jgi:hypothetical protein
MDGRTDALMGLLKERMGDISAGQIAEMIQKARAEAWAEARKIIQGLMVEAILEEALGELNGTGSGAERSTSTLPPPAGNEEQIRQEIAAIRKKITENESLLSQVRESTAGSTEKHEVAVEREAGTPGQGTEEGYGYYIYAIVTGDGSQLAEAMPEEAVAPAYPVYALPYQGIRAIVSQVPLQEFGQERLEAHLADLAWLKARVEAHEGVLEAMLARHTLIPVRFCTIYRSESCVQEMLAQHYDDFVDTLARLEGQKEWGVKVYCDHEALAQRIGEVSERARDLREEMANKPGGVAYFLKKGLEEAIAEEGERVRDECAQCSHDRLSGQAEESVVSPLQSRETTAREEEMILNGAYLVLDERLPAFRVELERLAEEYGGLGFHYELTGPWPAYNFVRIAFEEAIADGSVGS